MSKFICPTHGEVIPKQIYYSCPLQGDCPECNKRLEDIAEDAGIRMMTEEEAKAVRPEFYKNNKFEDLKKDLKDE